jgi:hypothetical protein
VTKRFVIATDPMTADEEKAFRKALGNMAWWHWLPNFWLVKDRFDRLNVFEIRDAVRGVNSTLRCLVLEVDHKTWAALTRPDAQGRDMAEWIKSTWIAE